MTRSDKNSFKNLSVDQFHKRRRKCELKKNKLQRDTTRKAVLKNQNHIELIKEMERIDSILLNPSRDSEVHENVLKGKKNKLREKFMKMIQMYEKDEPETAKQLKAAEAEYLKKRVELVAMHEQIKKAENVDLNSITLPTEPSSHQMVDPNMVCHIPFPTVVKPQFDRALKNLKPAGPPPGSPPSLSDLEDDILEGLDQTNERSMEENCEKEIPVKVATEQVAPKEMVPLPPLGPCPPAVLCQPRPFMNPLPHGIMPRPPPGPPPVMIPRRPPTPPPMVQRPMQTYPDVRLMNGAPYGLNSVQAGPSSYVHPGTHYQPAMSRGHVPSRSNPSVLDVNSQSTLSKASNRNKVVISGAPQIRNLVGEAIQFLPTAVMVKRQTNAGRVPPKAVTFSSSKPSQPPQTISANEAFDDFMNEINTLL